MNKILGSNLLLVIVIILCNICLFLLNLLGERASARWYGCHKHTWHEKNKKVVKESTLCIHCRDNCDLHELKEWN